MNISSQRTRAVVFVALPAALMLSACSSKKSTTTTPPAGGAVSSTPAATTGASGTALAITSFVYSPSPLTVAAGAVIAVTNNDSAEHTVTSDTKSLFIADDIKQGKTVSFTAPKAAGTYRFRVFCARQVVIVFLTCRPLANDATREALVVSTHGQRLPLLLGSSVVKDRATSVNAGDGFSDDDVKA